MARQVKSYHHGDLKHTLIKAACQHLAKAGAESLSLRALARDAGVSQTAPYRHFKTKSSLFAAIAATGFDELLLVLEEIAGKANNDIRTTLIEIGLGYVEWGVKNPEKYQLIFDSMLVDFDLHEELRTTRDACFSILIETIERGVAEGLLVDKPTESMAVYLWTSIHGITSLLLAKGHKLNDPEETDGQIVKSMQHLSNNTREIIELAVSGLLKV